MATKKSEKYPYKWPDGTYHSIPASQRNAASGSEVKIATPNGYIPVSQWDFNKPLGPTGAAASAPATPTPTGPVQAPPDSIYDDEVSGLGLTKEDTLAGLTGQRTRGLTDYGFNEDAGGKLTFDPNNPFSKAALLKKNYDISRRSSAQTMGSGGQLYSGAFQNQQDFVNRGELGADDALQKSLISFLAGNTQAGTTARTNYEIGVGKAGAARTARAADSALYSPTAAAPATPAAGPAGVGVGAAATSTKPKASALSGNTLTAAPGLKGVKKTKKGKTVTYSASVKGP